MSDDLKQPNLGHPDSSIRLASVVHRFRTPLPDGKIGFVRSFTTTGSHPKTKPVMRRADNARKDLVMVLQTNIVAHEQVVQKASLYIPLIHQILLTCKVQPEVARLDERLLFDWASGIERDRTHFKSEALMYDMVMAMCCEGLGRAGMACDASAAGDFKAASRDFNTAAGIFEFLEQEHLPKWIARGTVEEENLPSESTVGGCKGLKMLFLANSQQMAVATLLIKPGVPNYSLLGKLCLGIAHQMEAFVSTMRSEAFHQMSKMDKEFFTLITFQINLQKSLSDYFMARHYWDTNSQYGLAIALLSEATVLLRTRSSPVGEGVPDLAKTEKLHTLSKDLTDLRAHMALLLKTWEADNSGVYFDRVPPKVAAKDKLEKGLFIPKVVAYKVDEDIEPLPLTMPDIKLERTDSDIARELQEKLNLLGD